MKSVKIAMLILVVCLSGVGFVVALLTDEPECPSEEACALWEEFKEKHGTNWLIKWRDYIDAPGTIHGHYSIGRNVTDKDDAENISRAFIEDNEDLFKVDISNLRLANVGGDWNSYTSVYYQYYDDIRVEGGTVTVIVLKDGAIQMVGNGFYPNISISTTPVVTEDEAIAIAKDYFTSGKSWAETSLVILPSDYIELGKAERPDTLGYYLAWKVKFQEKSVHVDAENGDILGEYPNVVPVTISGTITGQVYPINNADSMTSPAPLPRQRIWIYDGSWNVKTWTIFDGSYSTTVTSPQQLGVSLEAEYESYGAYGPTANDVVSVVNDAGPSAHYEYTYGSYTHDYTFPDDTGHQPNIYYNIIRGYDYFSDPDRFSHYQSFTIVHANADMEASPCPSDAGACSIGTEIWYTTDLTKYSDPVLHEYTHNVIYAVNPVGWILPEIPPGSSYEDYAAMNEAPAAYFPISMNDDSMWEPDMRDLSVDFQAVDSNSDGLYTEYDNAHAVASALWEIRVVYQRIWQICRVGEC